jgi:hypothetical protein
VLYYFIQDLIVVAKADRRARLQLVLAVVFVAMMLLYSGSALWNLLFPRTARTYAVRGSITFQGAPLENGEIEFEPSPGTAQARTATIKSGTFALQAEEGLPRGKTYVLRIRGYRKTGTKYENADMTVSAEVSEQILPPRYNSESELKFETTGANLQTGISLKLE